MSDQEPQDALQEREDDTEDYDPCACSLCRTQKAARMKAAMERES